MPKPRKPRPARVRIASEALSVPMTGSDGRDVGEDVLAQDARRAHADDLGGVDVRLGLDRRASRCGSPGSTAGTKTTVIEIAAARMPPNAPLLPPETTIETTIASSSDGNAYSASMTSTRTRSSAAAEVARHQAERHADQAGQHDRQHDDLDRGAGPVDDPRQDVRAADRRAEPVLGRRGLLGAEDDAVGPVGVEVVRARATARRSPRTRTAATRPKPSSSMNRCRPCD